MTKLDEEYNQTEGNETYQTILVQDPEAREEPKDQNLPHPDFLATRGYFLRFLRGLLDTLRFRSAKSHFWKSKMFPTSKKKVKNGQREYRTYCIVMSVAICHFHVSMFGRTSREVRHDANDEMWKILRI